MVESPIRRRGWQYFRNWLTSPHPMGTDSIQGILEIADWYPQERPWLSADVRCFDDPYHSFGMLKELERDGYLKATWSQNEPDEQGNKSVRLDQIWLTPKGHELLYSLRERSRSGRIKKRLIDSFWIIIVAATTTLITLHVKSCS